MASEDLDKIKQRIKKILALAENNPSLEEAATAAAMAEKLMRKYQLTHSEVLAAELRSNSSALERTEVNLFTSPPTWVDFIAVGIGKLNDCIVDKARNSLGVAMRFSGTALDVELSREMLIYLVREVDRLAKQYEGGRKEKSNFRQGCGGRLQDRLKELAEEKKQEFKTSGTDLVVLKKQLVEDKYGKQRTETHKHDLSESTIAGMYAANGISLASQIQEEQNGNRLK